MPYTRHKLRKKESKELAEKLSSLFGFVLDWNEIDILNMGNIVLIIVEDEAVGFFHNDKPYLTIMGIMKYMPKEKWIEVDKNAIKFICNGADIMLPGIVNFDESINEGESVWIRDEVHKKPIAVGIAIMNSKEMKEKDKGKAVKNIHYIGDDIWNWRNLL
ncbi:MAG: PUA domain-containing protein [Candidatus Thermoplasmatota archaeon]